MSGQPRRLASRKGRGAASNTFTFWSPDTVPKRASSSDPKHSLDCRLLRFQRSPFVWRLRVNQRQVTVEARVPCEPQARFKILGERLPALKVALGVARSCKPGNLAQVIVLIRSVPVSKIENQPDPGPLQNFGYDFWRRHERLPVLGRDAHADLISNILQPAQP